MKRIVGWYGREEWVRVYEDLYSTDTILQKHAVDRIAVWKCRVLHRLATAIECSAELVTAHLLDIKYKDCIDNVNQVKLTMSMAITRFVNLITEKSQNRGYAQPVHQLAEELGIADWLVDLRHDATHSNLPSINLLRKALDLALEWLKYNYWEVELAGDGPESEEGSQPAYTRPYTPSKPVRPLDSEVAIDKLHQLFQQYFQNQSSRATKKNATENFITDLEKLAHSNKKEVLEVCVTDDYLLSVPQNLDDHDSNDLSLPTEVILFWQPVLKLFHHHHLTRGLLQSLSMALSDENTQQNRRTCCWLALIINNLHDPSSRLFKQSCEYNVQQLLDQIVRHPNIYTMKLLQTIFKVNDCGMSINQQEQMIECVQQYSCSTIPVNISTPVFTLSQLEGKDQVSMQENTQNQKQSVGNTGKWKLCTDVLDWNQYPLGTCPGVTIDYTNLELHPHLYTDHIHKKHSLEKNTDVESKEDDNINEIPMDTEEAFNSGVLNSLPKDKNTFADLIVLF